MTTKYLFTVDLEPKKPFWWTKERHISILEFYKDTEDPEEYREELWQKYVKLGYTWCSVDYTIAD
jgi:hypothetical protein